MTHRPARLTALVLLLGMLLFAGQALASHHKKHHKNDDDEDNNGGHHKHHHSKHHHDDDCTGSDGRRLLHKHHCKKHHDNDEDASSDDDSDNAPSPSPPSHKKHHKGCSCDDSDDSDADGSRKLLGHHHKHKHHKHKHHHHKHKHHHCHCQDSSDDDDGDAGDAPSPSPAPSPGGGGDDPDDPDDPPAPSPSPYPAPSPSPSPSPEGGHTTGVFKVDGVEVVRLERLDKMDGTTTRHGKWKLDVSKSDDDLTIRFVDDSSKHKGIMYAQNKGSGDEYNYDVSGEYARKKKADVSARRMLLSHHSHDGMVHYECDSSGHGEAKCKEKDDWHGWGHWKGHSKGKSIVSAITGIADAAQKTVVNYGIDVTESAMNGGKCPAGACQEDWSEDDN